MKNTRAVLLAVLAAIFYAINTPLSKLLLAYVPSAFMAAFLYLGAGAGIGCLYALHRKKEDRSERLERKDLLYTVGMIVLDIAAPIFLMLGIRFGNASEASLLGNFEIVATALIALLFFREKVTKKLWLAIGLITASSMILSFESRDGFRFSCGSLFVLLATLCWGLENNCTHSISEKSTYEIVTLKGLCSGTGSFVIACFAGERLPDIRFILLAMLLGFVAYGLSIFTYIKAQRQLGAAKTSAYYAIAPFIGAAFSFILLGDALTWRYVIALMVMIFGTTFVVSDTLVQKHSHLHTHMITHTHDGSTHSHTIEHEHSHRHIGDTTAHEHNLEENYENSPQHRMAHMNR